MLLCRKDGIVPADFAEHLDIFSVAPRCGDFQGSNLPKLRNDFCAFPQEYTATALAFSGINTKTLKNTGNDAEMRKQPSRRAGRRRSALVRNFRIVTQG